MTTFGSRGVILVIQQSADLHFRMTFSWVDGDQRTVLARQRSRDQREQKREWEIVTDRWGRIKSLQPKRPVSLVKAG